MKNSRDNFFAFQKTQEKIRIFRDFIGLLAQVVGKIWPKNR